MKWTTPKDLHAQVTRLWERGLVLQSTLADEPLFPRRLVLKGPSSGDLAHAFAEVRAWCDDLSRMRHLRFVFRKVNHRVTGTNTYPVEAWIDSPEDAIGLLGKRRDWERFLGIVASTRRRRPELLPWLSRRPLVALDQADAWDSFLDLAGWLMAHPRPDCYLRQVDLPGIHTKFIEAHRGVLAELFDRVLPAEVVDPSFTGVYGFCARYGFRDKPERIRFRVLDSSLDPFHRGHRSDITLDVDSLAALSPTPRNLFITENETNFLAFPDVADSWILFGAGYGFSTLKRLSWADGCRIFYWGDIDTHGFAVLDELRGRFPAVQSFLMDRATLLAHQQFWGSELSPCKRSLGRLTEAESSVYRDLQENRLGHHVRLEQERVSFRCLKELVAKLAAG